MKPEELFAAFGDLLALVCGRVYRAERLTSVEWDSISDRFLLLALAEKEKLAKEKHES